MMEWKDTTSYSRDEPEPRTPRTWSAVAGRFRVTVMKAHIYNPGEWMMHVDPGVLDTHDMRIPATTSTGDAQKCAEDMFIEILLQALEAAKARR